LNFFVQKHGLAGVKRVYTKKQLCSAYGIQVRASNNKQQLAHGLVEVLKARNSNDGMPCPHYLNRLHAEAKVNDGRVVLRLNRSD